MLLSKMKTLYLKHRTTFTYLTPNTRTPNWKEELGAQVEGKTIF